LFAIAVKIEQDLQDWMDRQDFVLNGSRICKIYKDDRMKGQAASSGLRFLLLKSEVYTVSENY